MSIFRSCMASYCLGGSRTSDPFGWMRTTRSGTLLRTSAASTLAARWRASASGSWCDKIRSRARPGPATTRAAHSTAVNSATLRNCIGKLRDRSPHAPRRPWMRSTLAAVDEALQHRREQLGRARAYLPILLPRAIPGNVQPSRVLLECQLTHLGAGLGEGLLGLLQRFALGRLEVDIGRPGCVFERLALVLV